MRLGAARAALQCVGQQGHRLEAHRVIAGAQLRFSHLLHLAGEEGIKRSDTWRLVLGINTLPRQCGILEGIQLLTGAGGGAAISVEDGEGDVKGRGKRKAARGGGKRGQKRLREIWSGGLRRMPERPGLEKREREDFEVCLDVSPDSYDHTKAVGGNVGQFENLL